MVTERHKNGTIFKEANKVRERIKDLIKIILFIGIGIVGITFAHRWESKATPPNSTVSSISDTITPVPDFYNKPAKDGLKEALIYYDVQFPDIVYAQAILETGHFKSKGCLEHHNLFGLYNSRANRYHRFSHWTESIIAYKEWIQRRYRHPEDYYWFLQRINYASDSLYTSKLKQIVRKEYDKRTSPGGGQNYP